MRIHTLAAVAALVFAHAGYPAVADTETTTAAETATASEAAAAQVSRPITEFTWVPKDLREGLTETKVGRLDEVLVNPDADLGAYTKIYMEPVTFAIADRRTEVGLTQADRTQLAATVMQEFGRTFDEGVVMTDQPGEGVLVLAFAIVQAEPNRDILGSYPVGRTNRRPVGRAVTVGIGSITMEIIANDGVTGEVVVAARDRFQGLSPLPQNFNRFTRWGDARDGIRRFARKMDDLLAR